MTMLLMILDWPRGMASSFFLLMVLTIDYGWGVATIQGNPFFDRKSCTETITDIRRLDPVKLHNQYYLNLKCDERKKNYLERKNDELLYEKNTVVDFL